MITRNSYCQSASFCIKLGLNPVKGNSPLGELAIQAVGIKKKKNSLLHPEDITQTFVNVIFPDCLMLLFMSQQTTPGCG